MIVCLCIYFKKTHYFKPIETDTLNFIMYILTILACPLKTYVIKLLDPISMNIFFTIKDHSFPVQL